MVLVLVEANDGEDAKLWRSERGAWVLVPPGKALVAFARARRYRFRVPGRWDDLMALSKELEAKTGFPARPFVGKGADQCRIDVTVPALMGHDLAAFIGQVPVSVFDEVADQWVVEIKLVLA